MTLPTGRQRRRRPPESGFTLIEVLMVLILMGILTGLSLPRFSATTQELRLINGARNLAKLLTYAQERAIVERVPYQAVFDGATGTYWLMRAHSEGKETTFVRIEGRYGRTVTLPSEIEFRFPVQAILFYPDGNSDPFSIELFTQERRFVLTEGVGHVRIQEEKG